MGENISYQAFDRYIGIDHGFSFPLKYFKKYGLDGWPEFLQDFQEYWPTGNKHTYVVSLSHSAS